MADFLGGGGTLWSCSINGDWPFLRRGWSVGLCFDRCHRCCAGDQNRRSLNTIQLNGLGALHNRKKEKKHPSHRFQSCCDIWVSEFARCENQINLISWCRSLRDVKIRLRNFQHHYVITSLKTAGPREILGERTEAVNANKIVLSV